MLYLLDANTLIDAHEYYYGIDQVPQFWDWISVQSDAGVIKMPFEIHDEIATSSGPLSDWINSAVIKKALILDEDVDANLLNHVLIKGYAPDLNDSELEKIGRDPFLVAYALAGKDRVVVTKEVSKPSKQRANRKVPDICNDVGIQWMTDFTLYKSLGFKTK